MGLSKTRERTEPVAYDVQLTDSKTSQIGARTQYFQHSTGQKRRSKPTEPQSSFRTLKFEYCTE